MTPASTPDAARYRRNTGGPASNLPVPPPGWCSLVLVMKWALPMTTSRAAHDLAGKCRAPRCTPLSECISRGDAPPRQRTTASIWNGKCSSRQAASCNTSRPHSRSSWHYLHHLRVARVRVPVLSNTMVSAYSASRYFCCPLRCDVVFPYTPKAWQRALPAAWKASAHRRNPPSKWRWHG